MNHHPETRHRSRSPAGAICFMRILALALAILVAAALTAPSSGQAAASTPKLTLPMDTRPEWLRRDGIVMAGSWEPLGFRVRRDGATGYTPTPEQRAAYEREQSPEMVAKLKSLGVNFVMMHCYKGGGLEAERESMADAVKFAKLSHDAGLRVGCYTYSGSFIWELFFKEMPQAKDWVVLNPDGSVDKLGIVRPSGYAPFDAAALDAVMSSAPFVRPPEAIRSVNGKVYLDWRFHRDDRQCGTFGVDPHILTAVAGKHEHDTTEVGRPGQEGRPTPAVSPPPAEDGITAVPDEARNAAPRSVFHLR